LIPGKMYDVFASFEGHEIHSVEIITRRHTPSSAFSYRRFLAWSVSSLNPSESTTPDSAAA
jgi:hypothetical protein